MAGDISDGPAARTAALLANLWERNLPMLHDRLATLDRASHGLLNGTLGDGSREEAAATAHKLAGSLGMFGHHDATGIAREIEQMLDVKEEPDPARFIELVRMLQNALPL